MKNAILILGVLALGLPALAQPASRLGAISMKQGRRQNYKPHRLQLRTCMSGKKVEKIQIISRHGRLKVKNLKVIFGNGQKQRLNFKPGFFTREQQSLLKNLSGKMGRCVKAITFQGLSPNGARLIVKGVLEKEKQLAKVKVKPGQMRHSRRPGRAYKQHRVMVRSCAGPNSKTAGKIQIISRGGRYKVKNFVITYGNGSRQRIPFKASFFTRGQKSQWKSLKGQNKRCIRSVSFAGFTPNNAKLILKGL